MVHNFKNSTILITGGTGTFGSAFLEYCIKQDVKEIRIFSRDEKKQYELKQKYLDNFKVKFYIGDVRDIESLNRAMLNVDYVFHAAAMKQVPSCEQNPMEAVKTNIIGSENVLNSAIRNKAKKIVLLSTDKAVEPTSVMGLTKACMEKIALQKAKEQSETEICITRFCNLISSNGSVVPLFINQIKNNQPLTVTDPFMSRYFMSLQQAIELVEKAFIEGKSGDIFIKKAKKCYIIDIAKALIKIFQMNEYPIKTIGARAGEKIEEDLFTAEETFYLKEFDGYYIIAERNIESSSLKVSDEEFMTLQEIVDLVGEIE